MARLSMIQRGELPADQRRFYDAVKAIRRMSVTGPFITFLNSSPELAARVAHLGNYFHARGQADESILPLRARTLSALVISRILDGVYEWSAWVPHALKAGVPQDTIDAIRDRGTPRNLTPEDALVIDICTQLLTGTHRVSDATYRAARDHFGRQGIVEFIANVGYFAMLAFPLNAFEITLSPEQLSKRDPGTIGLPI